MKNKDLFADNIKNIAAVKHENDLKIKEYEDKLTTANESRTSTMFQVQKYSKHFPIFDISINFTFFNIQLREEIENEFMEKMELLRNMYISEVENQVCLND